jgi:hypothetical protein
MKNGCKIGNQRDNQLTMVFFLCDKLMHDVVKTILSVKTNTRSCLKQFRGTSG